MKRSSVSIRETSALAAYMTASRAVQIIGQLVMLHARASSSASAWRSLAICLNRLRLLNFLRDFVAPAGFVVAQNPQVMQFVLRGIFVNRGIAVQLGPRIEFST